MQKIRVFKIQASKFMIFTLRYTIVLFTAALFTNLEVKRNSFVYFVHFSLSRKHLHISRGNEIKWENSTTFKLRNFARFDKSMCVFAHTHSRAHIYTHTHCGAHQILLRCGVLNWWIPRFTLTFPFIFHIKHISQIPTTNHWWHSAREKNPQAFQVPP